MAADMCDIHAFEVAEDRCGDCGRAYCSECVIYAFGRKKPPLCRACAIARAGVRKHAARPPVASRRAIRREAKERRRASKKPQPVAAEAAPAISADMDWDAVDRVEVPAQAPLPAPPPPAPPVTAEPLGAEPAVAVAAMSSSPVMTAPPPPAPPAPAVPSVMSIIDELPYAPEDEPELREVRPSFESRLTRRRL